VALKLEDKQAIVAEVKEVASVAHSAVIAEYRGLSVGAMTELRAKARANQVYLKVVRNTLARRAVEGTDFACIQEALTGPLILAFSRTDPGAAARVIGDFAKSHDKLVVKAVSISGKLLPASDLETLSKMPTYEQAVSMLMSVMQAPISKFVRTLAEPHAKLARTIAAIRDQKQAA
jgi:large subunit ribosomal protein L10